MYEAWDVNGFTHQCSGNWWDSIRSPTRSSRSSGIVIDYIRGHSSLKPEFGHAFCSCILNKYSLLGAFDDCSKQPDHEALYGRCSSSSLTCNFCRLCAEGTGMHGSLDEIYVWHVQAFLGTNNSGSARHIGWLICTMTWHCWLLVAIQSPCRYDTCASKDGKCESRRSGALTLVRSSQRFQPSTLFQILAHHFPGAYSTVEETSCSYIDYNLRSPCIWDIKWDAVELAVCKGALGVQLQGELVCYGALFCFEDRW